MQPEIMLMLMLLVVIGLHFYQLYHLRRIAGKVRWANNNIKTLSYKIKKNSK